MNQITMRVLKTVEEMKLVQQLEETVWDMGAIPVHQTLTAVKNGGLIIGAFDEEKLVGFSYSFAGFKKQTSIFMLTYAWYSSRLPVARHRKKIKRTTTDRGKRDGLQTDYLDIRSTRKSQCLFECFQTLWHRRYVY